MPAGIGNGISACSTSPINESAIMMVNCLIIFNADNSRIATVKKALQGNCRVIFLWCA